MIRHKLTLEQRIARLEKLLNSNNSAYTYRHTPILEKTFGSKSALKDLIANFDRNFIKNNITSHVHGYIKAKNVPGFDVEDEFIVNKNGIIIMKFIIIVEASLNDGSKKYYPVYVTATVEDGRLRVQLSGIGEKTAKVAGLFTDLQNDINEEELLWAIEDLKSKLLKEFKNKDVTKLSIVNHKDVEDGDIELEDETFNNSEYAK